MNSLSNPCCSSLQGFSSNAADDEVQASVVAARYGIGREDDMQLICCCCSS